MSGKYRDHRHILTEVHVKDVKEGQLGNSRAQDTLDTLRMDGSLSRAHSLLKTEEKRWEELQEILSERSA